MSFVRICQAVPSFRTPIETTSKLSIERLAHKFAEIRKLIKREENCWDDIWPAAHAGAPAALTRVKWMRRP